MSFGLFSDMVLLRDIHNRRSSSWDRSGGNNDWVCIPGNGSRHELLNEKGAGCIRHLYWTYIMPDDAFSNLQADKRNSIFREFVLRAFWNGSSMPSIEVPLGDFFGVTNGHLRPINSLAFASNPGFRSNIDHFTWGFNSYLPMPFAAGARIEIENQGPYDDARIWYHIDYELYDGDQPAAESSGFLHALWHRESPTQAVDLEDGKNLSGDDNYTILDIKGNGQFAGYFLTVVNRKPGWWGEGDDMIFIDGEKFPPSIHGTGTEEIFGGGASPRSEFSGLYAGFHCIENKGGYSWLGTNGMYRFHITDPIRFRRSIRVTIEHGHANNLSNDYSSVAFWYQNESIRQRPELPALNKRRIEDP